MGLDMYVRSTKRRLDKDVDFEILDQGIDHELFYWRKHPNLHGWMEQLYLQKGGREARFNLTPVVLTEQDIDRLERDNNNDALPHTDGFFFGVTLPSDKEATEAFIVLARAEFSEGCKLYYYAWW
jgi:hypothetical protein